MDGMKNLNNKIRKAITSLKKITKKKDDLPFSDRSSSDYQICYWRDMLGRYIHNAGVNGVDKKLAIKARKLLDETDRDAVNK
ncbi:MAG: hypothetical protein WC375_00065 [Methanomassiliicoccales archaeon]|jgi:hypothetical protein